MKRTGATDAGAKRTSMRPSCVEEAGRHAIADAHAGLACAIRRGPSSSCTSTSVYGASARNASDGARDTTVTACTVAVPRASPSQRTALPQCAQA